MNSNQYFRTTLLVLAAMTLAYWAGTIAAGRTNINVLAQNEPSALPTAEYAAISLTHKILLDQPDHQIYLPMILHAGQASAARDVTVRERGEHRLGAVRANVLSYSTPNASATASPWLFFAEASASR
jgi:hypothetical protein